MKNKATVKIIISFGLAVLLVVLSFTHSLDNLSKTYTQDAFNRALITYGIARAINGVISVAQGTEVAVQPAGLGVNFTPGQILDPINDLVERFSWVMLAATASLGIQQIFITISSSIVVSILLSIMLLLILFNQINKNCMGKSASVVVKKLLLFILFIRFAVPMTAIASEGMYRYFLAEQYTSSTQRLEKTRVAIGEISSHSDATDYEMKNKSLLDKASELLGAATSNMDMSKTINRYKETVEKASVSAINLIVVFIVHTIVFPLLLLWLLVLLLREFKKQIVLERE